MAKCADGFFVLVRAIPLQIWDGLQSCKLLILVRCFRSIVILSASHYPQIWDCMRNCVHFPHTSHIHWVTWGSNLRNLATHPKTSQTPKSPMPKLIPTLPPEIWNIVLHLMYPPQAARMGSVCKTFRDAPYLPRYRVALRYLHVLAGLDFVKGLAHQDRAGRFRACGYNFARFCLDPYVCLSPFRWKEPLDPLRWMNASENVVGVRPREEGLRGERRGASDAAHLCRWKSANICLRDILSPVKIVTSSGHFSLPRVRCPTATDAVQH